VESPSASALLAADRASAPSVLEGERTAVRVGCPGADTYGCLAAADSEVDADNQAPAWLLAVTKALMAQFPLAVRSDENVYGLSSHL
jgi:hypothetical protein